MKTLKIEEAIKVKHTVHSFDKKKLASPAQWRELIKIFSSVKKD